ncbi:hypothetical protein JTE90_019531 [Oedothorax gibbosus]|uniref:Uncharacterized protein n=1 Tax=Oedothorax gibbosus TaxID=931172 RepID=A0AAV6VIL5_9ARAC|nr:hypothetical protein JTE90_019531 [Oedothorax gibbosus]
MISAMPAVAVRRERKKQRSRRSSLSSLPSPSTRSSSLASSSPSPVSMPGNYYNYFARHQPGRRTSSTTSAASTPGAAAPSLPCGAPSRRPSTSVSTISSAASNYASALQKVRERQLDVYRERARFLVHTGAVLMASGATLVVIGLAAAASAAQTVGALFVCLGAALCLARVFCLAHREELPLVRRAAARTVSGQSIYAPSTAHPSAASTPDDSSTASSYYFPRGSSAATSPSTAAPPPLQPPPPPPVVVPGVHGAAGGHRSNPSSLLTPMSLNSIPEMQVLITDDSQRY